MKKFYWPLSCSSTHISQCHHRTITDNASMRIGNAHLVSLFVCFEVILSFWLAVWNQTPNNTLQEYKSSHSLLFRVLWVHQKFFTVGLSVWERFNSDRWSNSRYALISTRQPLIQKAANDCKITKKAKSLNLAKVETNCSSKKLQLEQLEFSKTLQCHVRISKFDFVV